MYFTTDAGNDVQITSGTSIASGGGTAADDISTGDAAVTIATSTGNITLDAQAGDADIIFKGTDDTSDITALTLDMSEAGAASFNAAVTVGTDLTVTGGDIVYGATNSTLSVGATAHDAAGATLSISGGAPTAGTSNNQAGGSVTISGGQGKGSGAGGDIVFKTANAGSSSSSLNALATALTISDDLSSTFAGVVNTGVVNSTVTAATGLTLDHNFSVTDASTTIGLDIDFDKTGASSSNNTMIGLNIDMDNTTATGGTNNMTALKVTPTCTHASGSGTVNIKGLEVVATGGQPNETSTVRALDLQSTGGDYTQGIHINTDDANGWDLKIVSSADTGDFCTLAVAANGATTLTTVDDDGANADLTFTVDGTFDVTATSSSFSSGVNVAGTTAHAASLVVDGAAASVALKEMANAPADTAAFGQLWVKTATPNELYFTTDAGNDIQITSGTAIAGGGGGVAADDSNLILHMQVFA